MVDDEDFDRLSKISWTVRVKHLESKNGRTKTIYMPRLIMNAPKGMQVDHINGNTLDNRKSNLRICTGSQNIRNRGPKPGKYKGVYLRKDRIKKRWRARIEIDKKRIELGHFTTAEEAAIVYNKAAEKYHKEFAYINKL